MTDKVNMKKHQWLFLVFSLCLTLLLSQAYSRVRLHFSGAKEFKAEAEKLNVQLHREQLKNELLAYQLKDFRQSVAQVLPDVQGQTEEQKYLLRNVASVVSEGQTSLEIDLSPSILSQGKLEFRAKNYQQAIGYFEQVLEKFPASVHVVESLFLKAESYFLMGQYPACLGVVEIMMEQFPENDLTGFILMRMAQIYTMRGESEQAIEIYRTILRQFQHNGLKAQAAAALKELERNEN